VAQLAYVLLYFPLQVEPQGWDYGGVCLWGWSGMDVSVGAGLTHCNTNWRPRHL